MNKSYTEQDLREGHNCIIALGSDFNESGSLEEHIASWFSRIRSEARAGMREACAKHRPFWQGLALVCSCGKWTYKSYADREGTQVQAQWEEHIRKLPDLAADEAIERIKAEAERTTSLIAATFGFKCAERGWNLERTLNIIQSSSIAALSGKV